MAKQAPRQVKDIMAANPMCVMEGTPIKEAIHQMRSEGHHFTSVVVVDNQGHVRGLLTGDQIIEEVGSRDGLDRMGTETVNDLMIEFPPSVSPSDEIKRAAHLMDQHRCTHLVVVESFMPVGIISHGDILSWLDNLES